MRVRGIYLGMLLIGFAGGVCAQGGGERPHGPPPEAIAACKGLASAAACSTPPSMVVAPVQPLAAVVTSSVPEPSFVRLPVPVGVRPVAQVTFWPFVSKRYAMPEASLKRLL